METAIWMVMNYMTWDSFIGTRKWRFGWAGIGKKFLLTKNPNSRKRDFVMAKEQIARDVGQPIPTVSSSSHNNHVSAMGRGVSLMGVSKRWSPKNWLQPEHLMLRSFLFPTNFPCSDMPWSTPEADNLRSNGVAGCTGVRNTAHEILILASGQERDTESVARCLSLQTAGSSAG